jgi:hypothetical protein
MKMLKIFPANISEDSMHISKILVNDGFRT